MFFSITLNILYIENKFFGDLRIIVGERIFLLMYDNFDFEEEEEKKES
jgi:hypothetical protein